MEIKLIDDDQVQAGTVINEPIAPPAVPNDDRLLEMVLASGKIDVLERYLALRESDRAKQAQLEFDRHFAEMQREMPPLPPKPTTVKNKIGKKLYDYYTLAEIVRAYGPIASKHGFSVRWAEETIDDGKAIRTTCIVSGYGHRESNAVDIPIMQGNELVNSIQQRGVALEYGRRYTYRNGLGIVIIGEDTDGRTEADEPAKDYTAQLAAIDACATLAELKTTFITAYRAAGDDADGQAIISAAKDRRKKELSPKGAQK